MNKYIWNCIFLEYTPLSSVCISLILNYETPYITQSVLVYDFITPILNNVFVMSYVCNQIVFDYLNISIKQRCVLEVYFNSMIIDNNNVYGVCSNYVHRLNLHTSRMKYIADFSDNEIKLIHSKIPSCIVDNTIINLANMKSINTCVILRPNDYRCIFEQYWYHNNYLYIQDALELKKYKIDTSVLVYAFKLPNMIDMLLDTYNDDLYIINEYEIEVINYYYVHYKRELTCYSKINTTCLYNDDLYVLFENCELCVYDKLAFCKIYTISLEYDTFTNIVINDNYMAISTKTNRLYIFDKN